MVQNKNNILKFKPKPKPLKYYICEFFKRYGEDENTYHYIFSNRNIDDMGYTGEDDDHKILSQFFLQKIYKKIEINGRAICIGLIAWMHL